ncbi:hypothetical protein REPUB_Repub11eG0025500 [Reevesia pubescens]
MATAFCLAAASNAVGTLIVEYAVKPVERRLRYLFRFSKIIEELQKKEEKLNQEQTRVQEDVNEAKRHTQTQVIEKYVEDWLKEADNVLKDVQSLEGRIEENKRCFRWCPNWIWRYRLSKEIEKKTEDITQLVDNSEFEQVGHRAELPGIEFMSSKDFVVSKSSTASFNEIMKALKDDKVNMIGVWGMGGVGKTTLVTEVGKKVKELQLFHKVIKAVVSQTVNIGKIQDTIADFIDLTFEKKTVEGKAEELWLRLKNEEKKVLIILDDMWDELKLKDIGIPIDEYKGCKIILTTRQKPVCSSMRCQVTVSLGVLDEEEAWTLFRMNASLDVNAPPDIIEVAMEVAKECHGLPIALVPLARALINKDLNGWKFAHSKLQNAGLIDIENVSGEVEKNAYLSLEMSYNHLRRETTKRCFLLCALYPEDYSIDVEDLVRYAWGLRLYQNADSIEQVRSEVEEAIDNLKNSCLVLEDKERYIKVHDVVRDVALWIASKENNGLVTKAGIGSQNESSKQKLEILLSPPLASFEGMQELKVLSLLSESADAEPFSFTALESLTNLRALNVEGFSKLKGISALAKLIKLEILSLRGSKFSEKLADELGELKNLRVLDLRGASFFFRVAPNLFQRLVHLEELYLLPSYGIDERSIKVILSELNSLSRLTSLSLELPCGQFPEGFVFPELQRYRMGINTTLASGISSRSLSISWELPLNVILKLLVNVELLEVSNVEIKCLTDTTRQYVPVAKFLQNLKDVRMENCKNLQVIFQMEKVENQAPLLSKLTNISLRDLPKLEYVWKMPIQSISLQSLKAVKIKGCGKLKSIFSFSLAQSLVLLEELEIERCGELEQIVEELTEGDTIPLCFQKLGSLKILSCGSLEYIFPKFMGPKGLPQLRKLWMENLSQLKQVFRPAIANQREEENGIVNFPSLLELRVISCPELTDYLEEAFTINTKTLVLVGIRDHNIIPEANREGLNELTSLELNFCRSLEYLVDATKEHVPNSAFSNLVELCLRRMKGLKMLCNGQFLKGFLQNLKKLRVEECGQLHELYQMDELLFNKEEYQTQLLSKLEDLKLFSLPELRWILRGPTSYFSLQSLKDVIIIECQKLKYLFSPSFIQSLVLLECLTIISCDELKTLFSEMESDGETESNSTYSQPLCLPKLRTLEIDGCRRLEYVLPITLAQGLPELEVAEVSYCPQLEQIFGVAKEQDGEAKEEDRAEYGIELPRLKDLQLRSLTNLSSFGPKNYFVRAPALEDLKIWWDVRSSIFKEFSCNIKELSLHYTKMDQKNLIANVELEGLTSLNLVGCKDLEFLVDTTVEHVPASGIFPNLVKLVMKELIGLKMVCNGQPPKGFLKTLEILEVKKCRDVVSLSSVTEGNLKQLRVGNCDQLQDIFGVDELLYKKEENQALLLSNIEHLELDSLPELRWIFKGPTDYFSLPSLKVVTIARCHKLKSLFSPSLIPSLRLLEKLKIGKCDNLERVFMELERGNDQIVLCLPKLEFVEISDCARLEYVFPTSLAQGLPCLRTLRLDNLNNLCGLIAEIFFVKLPALSDLRVVDCPRLMNFTIPPEFKKPLPLKKIFIAAPYMDYEESCNTDANTQLTPRSTNLEYMTLGNYVEPLFLLQGGYFISILETIKLEKLIWLRDIWKGHIQVVTNLGELSVSDCNRLTYIFPLMLIPNLPQLSTLEIRCCENLEQIIASDSASSSQGHHHFEKKMVFPQLQEVLLLKLPSLASFNPEGYHLVFPSLFRLEVEKCPKMMTSFSVDYSTLTVHAKTEAPRLEEEETILESSPTVQEIDDTTSSEPEEIDDTRPSKRKISWDIYDKPTSLPPYIEEPGEISSTSQSQSVKVVDYTLRRPSC